MSQRPIYLDHHATTPCDPAVIEAMLPWFGEHFGNAGSSQHAWGMRAQSAVDLAREQVASLIGAAPRDLVWTSGATESNNLALLGLARGAPTKRHLITVATEHKAVLDPMHVLEAEGWSLTVLTPRPDGLLDPDLLSQALRDDTALVSVMLANNEIGVLQPIAELARRCHARGALLHTDAAQATGKVPVRVDDLGADLVSLTAHKTCGPKGVGALYVRPGRPRIRLQPLQYGGGQERGWRSGTLPVPLLVGFGVAAQLAARDLERGEPDRLLALRERLWAGIAPLEPILHGASSPRLPNNLNLRFEGVLASQLMMAIRPIACSAGSACSSEDPRPSHVLTALGLDLDQARSAIRFGLGRSTTVEDIDAVVAALLREVPRLRGSLAP
jgi:cysteine desulfurase